MTTLGQINYETWCRVKGDACLMWEHLSEEARLAWEAAACDVVAVAGPDTRPVAQCLSDDEVVTLGVATAHCEPDPIAQYTCEDHPEAHGQPYADVVECSVCGRAMRTPEGRVVRVLR